MTPCLLCPNTNRVDGLKLGEVGWLCRRCTPDHLPPTNDPAELRLLLLLGRVRALNAEQVTILARLTEELTPHDVVRGLEADLAQLRRLGLVESVGGTARRRHRLTEVGLTMKTLLPAAC